MSPSRREFLHGTAATAVAALAGCSGPRAESTRTIPVDGISAVTVANEVGPVRVRGADRHTVRADLVKTADAPTVDLSNLAVDLDRRAGTLALTTSWTGTDPLFGGRPSLAITLAVPETMAVPRVETRVGDITVTDVTGDPTVRTDTGDISVERVPGTVTATSHVGDVHVRSCDQVAHASTATGTVKADVPALTGAARIAAETGDVEAAVAPTVAADLTARTTTGEVTVGALPLAADARTDTLVTGAVNGGGPALTIETVTGDVLVTALD